MVLQILVWNVVKRFDITTQQYVSSFNQLEVLKVISHTPKFILLPCVWTTGDHLWGCEVWSDDAVNADVLSYYSSKNSVPQRLKHSFINVASGWIVREVSVMTVVSSAVSILGKSACRPWIILEFRSHYTSTYGIKYSLFCFC